MMLFAALAMSKASRRLVVDFLRCAKQSRGQYPSVLRLKFHQCRSITFDHLKESSLTVLHWEPDDGAHASLIDDSHDADLLSTLGVVVLIDTDLVNPKPLTS